MVDCALHLWIAGILNGYEHRSKGLRWKYLRITIKLGESLNTLHAKCKNIKVF